MIASKSLRLTSPPKLFPSEEIEKTSWSYRLCLHAQLSGIVDQSGLTIVPLHETRNSVPHTCSTVQRSSSIMAGETFNGTNVPGQYHFRMPASQPAPPKPQISPFESDIRTNSYPFGKERGPGRSDIDSPSAILMRNLPRHTSHESLRTMLLFAKDLIGADFVNTDSPNEKGYLSAIARFRTSNAAHEARNLLDGKQNSPNEAPMMVDVLPLTPAGGPGGLGPRRNTFDTAANRGTTSSTSSTNSSNGQTGRQSSRFNGTFQAMDRISPGNGPLGMLNNGPLSLGELPTPDLVSPFQSFFPPQSPKGQPFTDRQRLSGKAVIGEDGADDEPGELLKDPVAYAKNDMSGSAGRRPTSSQLPTLRFAGLSLSTNGMTSPPQQSFTSPRSIPPMQSPTAAMSPTGMSNMGPNLPYQLSNQHFQRHNYPPVNPADQNPPCNTLYVGNLPIDTSEDELKAMFSKQRGYKRLCFRTKQNGPMCFVEFEDVSFATKALNELYGHPLHNSVKGGIRLSFSKNPLGVRTGQPGSMGPPTPMSPQGPIPGMNGMTMAPFSTANGPPPGLAVPPGLGASHNASMVTSLSSPTQGNMMTGGFGMSGNSGNAFGMAMKSPTNAGMPGNPGPQWPSHNGLLPDYMLGR